MTSIVIPYYKTNKSDYYLARCIESIKRQTYTDYEIVVSDEGRASQNTNAGVFKATGDIVLVLCMDDYFTYDNALKDIMDNFKGHWLIHGVSNHLNPHYTGDVHLGNNRLGGLSSMVFRRDSFIPFDEDLIWLLDCDWHKKMYQAYGLPVILNGDFVTIEQGDDQATSKMSKEIKLSEFLKMNKRYV